MLRAHREGSVSGARFPIAYVLAMTSRAHRLALALCMMAGCTGPTIERPPGEDGAIAIDAGTMPPMDGASACLTAVEPCTQTSECCGDLECGTTTAGQVCCGNEGASCAAVDGEDCCGALLCVDGRCVGESACSGATTPCTSTSECCGDLECGTTTLGQVCCGNEGASCATANGEDCCGALLCIDGVCATEAACSDATTPCASSAECCGDLTCGTTTLGQVCCGNEGATCATAGGEDCCGSLLCVSGRCGTPSGDCHSPCFPAPALAMERTRLAAIGGSFLGICGDASHTYGYHVPAARLPSSDYSMRGAANVPVCEWHGCAIDIGMNWPASRSWLRWLIQAIREDRIMGIAEVIGSYDGVNVRYWSDSSGWSTDGMAYTGSGHDSWTHVSIYRSTALTDHGILAGWTATSGPP